MARCNTEEMGSFDMPAEKIMNELMRALCIYSVAASTIRETE